MILQLPEFKMVYGDTGVGNPILFIHGYPLSRKIWAPQTGGLKRTARILTPDLRGFGKSTLGLKKSELESASMDLFASDCIAFLDALNITQPVTVCGLSMGGYIALALLHLYPERVAGLVLTATKASADSLEAKTNREKAVALVKHNGPQAIAESMLPKMLAPGTYQARPELVDRVRRIMSIASVGGIISALHGMKNRPDSTPWLPHINKPTLIIHGTDDQLIPLREAESMTALIPNSELVVLPNAGHLLNLEQPALFNKAVRKFQKRLSVP